MLSQGRRGSPGEAGRKDELAYKAIKFGPLIAANLRRRRPPPTGRWHLDEMVVKIGGQRMWLWRARSVKSPFGRAI